MPAVEVTLHRADEKGQDIINELLKDADNAMQVDCAGPDVTFVVQGWFVFPKGSLAVRHDVDGPS